VFEQLKDFDAILLGAMGLPGVRRPDDVEMTTPLDLRERLDLYCGLRPACLYHSADSPLRSRIVGSIDILLVWESTEGLFFSGKEQLAAGAPYAEDKLLLPGAERVICAAFRAAMARRWHLGLIKLIRPMRFLRWCFLPDLR